MLCDARTIIFVTPTRSNPRNLHSINTCLLCNAWGVLEAWTSLDFVSHTREKQFYTLCNRSLNATCCRESDRRAEKCSTCEGSRHEFCALREEGKLFLEIGILRATRRVTVDVVVQSEQLLFSPFSCIYIYYAQLPPLLKSIKSLLIKFRV